MKRKWIIAASIVLVALTGILIIVLSAGRGGTGSGGGVIANRPTLTAFVSDLFRGFRSTVNIRSDGKRYTIDAIDAVSIATKISEGESLPVVGDRQTLLKLLKDRGVLYNDTQRYRSGSIFPFDAAESATMSKSTLQNNAVEDVAMAPPASAEMDMGGVGGGGDEYSSTNEQVAGVNEGDIVKTDGQYIYAMSMYDGVIRIIKADGANSEIVSIIKFDVSWADEFYLIGDDRLAVLGGEYVQIKPLPEESLGGTPRARMLPEYDYHWGGAYNDFTILIIFDISDRAAPTEIRRISMDGGRISSRVMGNNVYLVTNKHIWGVPYNQADSPSIMPYCRDTAAGEEYQPLSLSNVYYIPDSTDTSYLMVGAIDVYSDEQFEPTAYLGAGSNLYMSQNAMYVTTYRWEETANWSVFDSRQPGGAKTDVMRFVINGTDVSYSGMGTVDGSPINQYSMDEYNGYFRIASTDWNAGTYVTVLTTSDMKTVGRTTPLAPGEQMHSMRFMGDMGYVVTFLNVDPLFTIDLSDPHNPKVLGELKIPGFSQYLHPVGDGLLLGIGRDTRETFFRDANGQEVTTGFQDTGLKVSLFDVRKPSDPKEIDVLLLGEGWTEVSYNPRALMCDSSRRLYGFISESVNNRGIWSGNALLLGVKDDRLSVVATLTPEALVSSYGGRLCFIGNTLYLIYDRGISVYDYSGFSWLGDIKF